MGAVDLFSFAESKAPFAIEKDVPVASDRSCRQRRNWEKPTFPFDRMAVNDSFAVYPRDVGLDGEPLIVTQNLVSGSASAYAKQCSDPRPRFTTRQQGGVLVRCWRVG